MGLFSKTDPNFQMPPQSEEAQYWANTIDELINDANTDRTNYINLLDNNRKLYLGAHKEVLNPGTYKNYIPVNRILNSVNLQHSILTEDPVRPVVVPRETNEEPDVFLSRNGVERVQESQLAADLTPEQLAGEAPIEYETAVAMTQETAQTADGEEVNVFEEDDFVFVTDSFCAEALTQELQSEFILGDMDCWWNENNRDKLVYGWKDAIVQWDEDQKRITVEDLKPHNCWIDPLATQVSNATYYIASQTLKVREAQALWPEFSDEIAALAEVDTLYRGGYSTSTMDGRILRDRAVELFTLWVRDYPAKMSVEDAEIAGEIEVEYDDEGVPTKYWYIQEDEDAEKQEATMEDDQWPTEPKLWQVQMIGQQILLSQQEAPFFDIPVSRNKNIGVPDSPHAIGVPDYLKDLQDCYNRMWSIFYEHFKRYRSSEQWMPESLLNALEDSLKDMHSEGGRKMGVDDDLYMQFSAMGGLVHTVDPPQMMAQIAEMINKVGQEIDLLAGTSMVLRGDAKSEWSGELFEQATQNARGPIGLTARESMYFAKNLFRTGLGLIIDFLDVETWAERNTKYDPAVLQAVKDRIKLVGYDLDIQLSATTRKDAEFTKISNIIQTNPDAILSDTLAEQYFDKAGIENGAKIAAEIRAAKAAMQAPPPQA